MEEKKKGHGSIDLGGLVLCCCCDSNHGLHSGHDNFVVEQIIQVQVF